jgi:hypothetical protein
MLLVPLKSNATTATPQFILVQA